MIVTKVRLQGLYTVDLPIVVAQPSDPFIIKSADGLGPPGYDVSIVNGVYQGRVARDRELVFRIGLNPNFKLNQTAAQLREQLYTMLAPPNDDDSVEVSFMEGDKVVATTQGWVSNIELVLFAKEPEVQLTFPCVGAYLQGLRQEEIIPDTRDAFSFINVGSAPVGVELEVAFTSNLSKWTVSHGSRVMKLTYDFKTGDILHIDTRENTRSIRVTHAGVEKEIIYALSRDSSWITLQSGPNSFTTDTQNYTWGYVRYTPAYLGV